MSTHFHDLTDDDRALLRETSSAFLDGECYAYAQALHEGLEWPLVGLMDGDVIRHAAVRAPNGAFLDIRGFVFVTEFGKPFGLAEPYIIREVSVADLKRCGEPELARTRMIARARKVAEALHPHLPWKDSLVVRTRAFCDDLEELCRAHGFWIRSSFPGAKPILCLAEGDEEGYEVRLIASGPALSIDRVLE